jgi:hypothetical protein
MLREPGAATKRDRGIRQSVLVPQPQKPNLPGFPLHFVLRFSVDFSRIAVLIKILLLK